MEQRVARLEDDVKDIKSLLKELQKEFSGMRGDLARIDGRISQLPSIWQTITLTFGLVGSTLTGVFLILRFGIGNG